MIIKIKLTNRLTTACDHSDYLKIFFDPLLFKKKSLFLYKRHITT